MMKKIKLLKYIDKLYIHMTNEAGLSLVSMAVIVAIIGITTASTVPLYERWQQIDAATETDRKMTEINEAIDWFVAVNGRYPCPAPLDAQVDDALFGKEVSDSACDTVSASGTFIEPGFDASGSNIRTGAVPVRALGIPDELATDAWGNRYVYSVTTLYAIAGAPLDRSEGNIALLDTESGEHATSVDGNIIHLLLSMGPDTRGAYNNNGVLIEPCDPASDAGDNCAFNNGQFTNTVFKNYVEGNAYFTNKVRYSVADAPPCSPDELAGFPGRVSYLMDTSGSMDWSGMCPPELGTDCRRIDVARWALRRVIPARMAMSNYIQDAGLNTVSDPENQDETVTIDMGTGFTGFVARNNVRNVTNNLGDYVFDDEFLNDPDSTDSDANSLNNALDVCPTGNTPLGIHLEALANDMENGLPSNPNKILVISDGISNNGTDPVTVANQIASSYDNVEVHIVDVVGNPSLEQVAQITGGEYHRADNPQALLDALFDGSGTCSNIEIPIVPDETGC